MVVLNEVHIHASGLLKVQLIVALEEKTTLITEDLRLQNQHLG
jgi:hypothetical protein